MREFKGLMGGPCRLGTEGKVAIKSDTEVHRLLAARLKTARMRWKSQSSQRTSTYGGLLKTLGNKNHY